MHWAKSEATCWLLPTSVYLRMAKAAEREREGDEHKSFKY
jgi:hypothetical protein